MAWFFSGKDYGNLLHPSYSPDHLFKLLQYIFSRETVYCEEVKIEYFFAMKSEECCAWWISNLPNR